MQWSKGKRSTTISASRSKLQRRGIHIENKLGCTQLFDCYAKSDPSGRATRLRPSDVWLTNATRRKGVTK
jgi:hypothetical protein